MAFIKRIVLPACVVLLMLWSCAAISRAQDPNQDKAPDAANAAAPEAPGSKEPESSHEPAPVEAALNPADNAWMLTSSALVLMMTGPGLALFYCGLVRKKNVLSVMMQCIFLMGLMTVVWALWGYSLAFGGTSGNEEYNPYIGNLEFLFMQNVTPTVDKTGNVTHPIEVSIPRLT
ncbi:MAG TPA: hypothetical protein VGJ26_11160, partial [Pirellulales bacterium]